MSQNNIFSFTAFILGFFVGFLVGIEILHFKAIFAIPFLILVGMSIHTLETKDFRVKDI